MVSKVGRSAQPTELGFTLIEAMAVVVIVGILAVIATYSVRKYVHSAKTSEALGIIASTKAAQESYKDETFGYLPVSLDVNTDYYPDNAKYGRDKMQWGADKSAGGTTGAAWRQLGVTAPGPVRFVYTCVVSNDPTSTITAPQDITIGNWPSGASGKPWYVIKAMADFDGTGTKTVFVGTSFTGDIFSAND
jgi:prepilin-type N-terminal cleavage/methylation domain-containing protein